MKITSCNRIYYFYFLGKKLKYLGLAVAGASSTMFVTTGISLCSFGS